MKTTKQAKAELLNRMSVHKADMLKDHFVTQKEGLFNRKLKLVERLKQMEYLTLEMFESYLDEIDRIDTVIKKLNEL